MRVEPIIEALRADLQSASTDFFAILNATLRNPAIPPDMLVTARARYDHARAALDAALVNLPQYGVSTVEKMVGSQVEMNVAATRALERPRHRRRPKRPRVARNVVLSGIAVGVALGLALRWRR